MEFPILIGQDRVAEALAASVVSSRVAHAYLFYGPEGSGKRAAAITFAAALQCSNLDDGRACGQCNACRRTLKLSHPDVHVLLPVPKNTDPSEIAERLRLLGQNPYDTVDFARKPVLDSTDAVSNKQVIFSRDRIGGDLRREMGLTAVEGGYRIAILVDADRMRTEAANAFLKLLEEPGKRTVFVLTSDRPDRLLPTIRSRCQLLRFRPLDDHVIAEALSRREAVDSNTAAALSRMADGSYSRALDLASNEELFATRMQVLEFLRAAWLGNSVQILDFVEQFIRMGRETLKFFLTLMLGWFRDLLLFRTLGGDARIMNLDQMEEIRKFCDHLPDAQIESMIALVEEAAYLTVRNLNLRLVFIVLAQSLGRAMRGEVVGKLIDSLSDEPLAVSLN